MLHSRTLNNEIEKLHERAIRIVSLDFKANLDELLEKYGSFSIHHRNIHIEIENFGYWNIQIFERTRAANNKWGVSG